MKIAVSIGHTMPGSVDSGAVGYLNESLETRSVGDKVKSYLEAQGHIVVLCRIDNASSVNASLAYRVNKANTANVDLFIEIHFNAGGGTGTETYIVGRGGKAEVYATSICNSISELGFPKRGVKVANFYVLRNTIAPAVLIECCFVDTKADADRYNADKMARKIVKGITGVEPSSEPTFDDNSSRTIYIATAQCNIVDSNEKVIGILYAGQRCELKWVTEDYRKYVRVEFSSGKVIEGLVEKSKTGSVVDIEDAYNYYNCTANTVEVKANSDYTGSVTGVVWKNEKICLIWVNDLGNAFIAYDNAAGEKLIKTGYVPAKVLCKI